MYSLGVIKNLNARFQKGKEGEHNRHCSYHQAKDGSLILHSAKKRSTAYVSAGNYAKRFLVKWFGTNSTEKRDALVESHF